MNYADSNNIRNLLNSYHLKETDSWENADIIFLATCSIRQQAEDKVSGWGIKNLEEKIIILTGCMAQRYNRNTDKVSEKYIERLKRRYPWIDYVVNIKEIEEIPKFLKLDNRDLLNSSNINYDPDNKYQGLFSTSHGCDNFCSYCIVPYARGKLINYAKKPILKDIKNFIDKGGKLVTLLGQNVNSWEYKNENFIDLLKQVESIKGNFWINFLSSHPKDFSDELIDLITTHDKFLKHCNIAVQSGSNRILKLMNRQYTADRFTNICKKIKEKDPDFRITTDAIVGFPTETEDDFQKMVDIVKEYQIEMVYIGKYSPRKDTVAYKSKDNISLKVKKDREKKLREVVNKIREKKHSSLVNNKLPVLMIKPRKGISYYNHEVITENRYTPGNICHLEVKDFTKAGLKC